jgi:hypothetical protein
MPQREPQAGRPVDYLRGHRARHVTAFARPGTLLPLETEILAMAQSMLRSGQATALILLVPLVAMQVTDEVDWGVADLVFAGVRLGGTGVLLELAARKPRNVVHGAATTAIGVAAIVLGEADDAPGLVLFGGLLIVATVARAVRTAQRSG